MKYLAIAALLAIVAGAVVYHFDHDGQPPRTALGVDAALSPNRRSAPSARRDVRRTNGDRAILSDLRRDGGYREPLPGIR